MPESSYFSRNRILFGAPGTGKSFNVNRDKEELLKYGGEYERVTFHPDYSYANFVGTYKPVMVSSEDEVVIAADKKEVLSILNDESKMAQEKYDMLYDRFHGEGLTRLPILLGLCTDENFKTMKKDGTGAVSDNSVERNHGKAIRPYVHLRSDKKVPSEIAYEYVPGPFVRTLVKALKNAETENPRPYLLIIEEINRANVAAVFGDVFQLLDRKEDGVSEYPICATEDIKKFLAKPENLGGKPEDYKELKIPNNMFIWATMNSADQGVFPMDTAFKRRWDFTYLGIDDSEEELIGKTVELGKGQDRRQIEWNELRKAINRFLADKGINEDKQLGPYFIAKKIAVPESGSEIDSKQFADTFKNKVLMYLFEDAAKQRRSALFEGCKLDANRYSEICRDFDNRGIKIFCKDITDKIHSTDLSKADGRTANDVVGEDKK